MSTISPTKTNKIDQQKINELIETGNIPTLPIVAQKLVSLCKDENANFSQFAQVLESDQGLASRILKVANSAYYGLRIKATTVERAITVLGLKFVKSIALGFHLTNALNSFESAGFDIKEFWHLCLIRGVLARQVAIRYCPQRREEAFLIGLLMDSGVPLLVQVLGNRYVELQRKSKLTHTSIYLLEKKVFEYDHVTAAAAIMDKWELPEMLSVPIKYHHLKSVSIPSMAEEVQLSQIAYFVGTVIFNDPESLCEEDLTLMDYCTDAFGIMRQDIPTLLKDTREEFSGISNIFSDVISDKMDMGEIFMNANALLGELTIDIHRAAFNCHDAIKHYGI